MLDYGNFYDIAVYGNTNWKGSFTPKEIACNAYDYNSDYDYAMAQGKPNRTMIELCKLICEDMDWQDYIETMEESENALTIEQMNEILENFIFSDHYI